MKLASGEISDTPSDEGNRSEKGYQEVLIEGK